MPFFTKKYPKNYPKLSNTNLYFRILLIDSTYLLLPTILYSTMLTNKLNIYRRFIKYCIFILWTTVNMTYCNSHNYSKLQQQKISTICTTHFLLKIIQKTTRNCRVCLHYFRVEILLYRILIRTFQVRLQMFRIIIRNTDIALRKFRIFLRMTRGVLRKHCIFIRKFRRELRMICIIINMFRITPRNFCSFLRNDDGTTRLFFSAHAIVCNPR